MKKSRKEYDMRIIGRNLRRLRKALGFTADDVAEYLCLGSAQSIYKYESGKSYPRTDSMLALMELYGAELKDLLKKRRVNKGFLLFISTENTTIFLEQEDMKDKEKKHLAAKRIRKYMEYTEMFLLV